MNQYQKYTLLLFILITYRVMNTVAVERALTGVALLDACTTMDEAADVLTALGVDAWEANDAAYFLTNPEKLTAA